jgi:hypothetical protein
MSDDLTEIAKQALEPVGDIVKRIAGPLADEIGESLALIAKPYRIMLSVKMFQKTQRMLKEAGITPQAVPPRLFLPILEGASIQDDDDLHSRWAALLANAATSPTLIHPSYIEILKQLTPQEAQLLDRLYDHCLKKRTKLARPWVDLISWAERERRSSAGENPEEAFETLIRLGLVQPTYKLVDGKKQLKIVGTHAQVFKSSELKEEYELTDVAFRFVQACRAPKTVDAESAKL